MGAVVTMKSILVIGLGRFGRHIARKFSELGNEVLAVDISEEKITEIMGTVTDAQIGDCTKKEVLQALGVRNFDICVVAMGSNLSTSLEITYLLKGMGASYILARASREMHGKFLLSMGADEIIDPERQMAYRIAIKHSFKKAYDYIEIAPEYAITEIPVPEKWVGDTIEHVAVRTKYHINILATKLGDEMTASIKPSHVFSQNEHIIVFGRKDDIIKFSHKI